MDASEVSITTITRTGVRNYLRQGHIVSWTWYYSREGRAMKPGSTRVGTNHKIKKRKIKNKIKRKRKKKNIKSKNIKNTKNKKK